LKKQDRLGKLIENEKENDNQVDSPKSPSSMKNGHMLGGLISHHPISYKSKQRGNSKFLLYSELGALLSRTL
jgi:hypothetical protein